MTATAQPRPRGPTSGPGKRPKVFSETLGTSHLLSLAAAAGSSSEALNRKRAAKNRESVKWRKEKAARGKAKKGGVVPGGAEGKGSGKGKEREEEEEVEGREKRAVEGPARKASTAKTTQAAPAPTIDAPRSKTAIRAALKAQAREKARLRKERRKERGGGSAEADGEAGGDSGAGAGAENGEGAQAGAQKPKAGDKGQKGLVSVLTSSRRKASGTKNGGSDAATATSKKRKRVAFA